MSAMQLLLIACGGAAGALCRYGVGLWVTERLPHATFPWGTFVINVTGSLVLGFIATLLSERYPSNTALRPLIMIGFIGAYTTFSTFEYETARIQSSWLALANLSGSVVVGYAAVFLGIRLGHWVALSEIGTR